MITERVWIMDEKVIERPRFYCENIHSNARVKAVYLKAVPGISNKTLIQASCEDDLHCPISDRKGNNINPNYDKCLFYLYLKKLGIAE